MEKIMPENEATEMLQAIVMHGAYIASLKESQEKVFDVLNQDYVDGYMMREHAPFLNALNTISWYYLIFTYTKEYADIEKDKGIQDFIIEKSKIIDCDRKSRQIELTLREYRNAFAHGNIQFKNSDAYTFCNEYSKKEFVKWRISFKDMEALSLKIINFIVRHTFKQNLDNGRLPPASELEIINPMIMFGDYIMVRKKK